MGGLVSSGGMGNSVKRSASLSLSNQSDSSASTVGAAGTTESRNLGTGAKLLEAGAQDTNIRTGGFGSVVTVNESDRGAIASAFDFARQTLNAGFLQLHDAAMQQQAQQDKLTAAVAGAVTDNSKTPAADLQSQLVTLGGLMLAGLALWVMVKK